MGLNYSHQLTFNEQLIKIFNKSLKKNRYPWKFINKISNISNMDVWKYEITRHIIGSYLTLYSILELRDYQNVKYYEIFMISQQLYGISNAKHIHLTDHNLDKYLTILIQLIINEYINKKEHYPLSVSIMNIKNSIKFPQYFIDKIIIIFQIAL